jgi:hypothetical protein
MQPLISYYDETIHKLNNIFNSIKLLKIALPMLKRTSGIYCWTDASRAPGIFKLGMSGDILCRLEQERSETSNTGTLLFHFILECEEGKEKEFEKWAKHWLKEQKVRLCDHGFQVNANKEWFLYHNIQELLAYCVSFPHYSESYQHTDDLPTSWGMLSKRIKVWKHFENLPEGIKSAAIKSTDKSESNTDIEYTRRKDYFANNRITLENLVVQHNQQSCLAEPHRFEFIKNKDRETDITHTYKMTDFVHDLETKRLKIVPCCGCYPIFQPNQLAHIGGCMGELEEDMDI